MSAAAFLRLARFEMGRFAGERSTWMVLSLLGAAMAWGAANGQRHVNSQQAAVARIHTREMEAIARQKTDVRRYSQPSTIALPYWQDPTDVAGYMRYGLTAFAVKPPSPLGALAIGQSNLVPFYLRARLDFISQPEAAFDFENPRALAVGSFDLAFVLVYLLPLALVVLSASRLSAERDSGALRLIAAQPSGARQVVCASFGAVGVVSVPAVLAGTWLALAFAGVPMFQARLLVPMTLVALAISAYALFWIGLAALIAPRTGATASIALLVTAWIVSAFLISAIGALGLDVLHPAPSRLQYLDALRRESDWTDKQRNALITSYLADRPAYTAGVNRIADLPYATKQIAVQTELERRLHDETSRFDRARADAGDTARWIHLLSPSLVLDVVLQTAAGADTSRQEAFLLRAREYTEQLRGFFWPRALKEAAQPTVRPCVGCPAKMAFLAHDDIPKFVEDDPVSGVAGRLAPIVAYLWVVAVATIFLAWRPREFQWRSF